jgi:outer membrane protein assembly factor BamA
MRPGLALFAVLVAACLITAEQSSHGQIGANPLPETVPGVSCPPLGVHGQPASAPEISIAGVSFSGALQIPVADQDEIAELIKRETHGTSVDGVTDEALERVRAGWQNRGYFKVQVNGQARLASSAGNQRIALFVNVDEGAQYRLSGITFKNNRAISNVKVLRRLFPIEDGEVFSREKIGKGLENLRYAYLEFGYLNFTSVPDTSFDDERETISLKIDVDEGKQFYVRSIDVWGLDESAWQEMLKDFPVGNVYNARLLDVFLKRHSLDFSSDDPRRVTKRLDERAGTVAITLDARPCPVN